MLHQHVLEQLRADAGPVRSSEGHAGRLVGVLDGLSPADSGKCFAWDGSEVPA